MIAVPYSCVACKPNFGIGLCVGGILVIFSLRHFASLVACFARKLDYFNSFLHLISNFRSEWLSTSSRQSLIGLPTFSGSLLWSLSTSKRRSLRLSIQKWSPSGLILKQRVSQLPWNKSLVDISGGFNRCGQPSLSPVRFLKVFIRAS